MEWRNRVTGGALSPPAHSGGVYVLAVTGFVCHEVIVARQRRMNPEARHGVDGKSAIGNCLL
jgi:hypothetical protein